MVIVGRIYLFTDATGTFRLEEGGTIPGYIFKESSYLSLDESLEHMIQFPNTAISKLIDRASNHYAEKNLPIPKATVWLQRRETNVSHMP